MADEDLLKRIDHLSGQVFFLQGALGAIASTLTPAQKQAISQKLNSRARKSGPEAAGFIEAYQLFGQEGR